MMVLDLANQIKQMVSDLDNQIADCYIRGIDCSYLNLARGALTSQLTVLEQSMDYKMEMYGYYGVPPDPEDLQSLLEEVGYDQARYLYGDDLDAALAEIGTV